MMRGPIDQAKRATDAARDLRTMLREHRRQMPPPAPVMAPGREQRAFPPGKHDQAAHLFRWELRAHTGLEERESRLCELVEYFGYDIGARAAYCGPWLYWDDPRRHTYVEKLGLDEMTFGILHMYSLFNRLDPAREDLYYIYDGLLARLQELGGPEKVSVLDFGCGLGQAGLSFALRDYRTLMIDVVDEYLDFVRFLAANRGITKAELLQANSEEEFYETSGDGHDYGLIIEWSTFEHVGGAQRALERVLGGLVPGGVFVTTTFCKEWTEADIEHYKRDTQDDALAAEYMSGEIDAWLKASFDVLSPPGTIAKVLIKR
jgi:SAM-dependent methyltransferase